MNNRQMLEEVLKDIEEIDHKLDEIRRALNLMEEVDGLDEAARLVVEVKRKAAKYLAGA